MISENFVRLQEQIQAVCRRIGRDPKDIIVVGVTKYSDAPDIVRALEAGLEHIGENKVQDAGKKFALLQAQGKSPLKHMVGHLQTNKVKDALKSFDIIQSVDSLKLARVIEEQASRQALKARVLVQVNTSGERQKFGIPPEDADTLFEAVQTFTHVEVKGLMAIAPLTEDQDVIRHCFSGLRHVHDHIKERFDDGDKITMQYLSMGMSQDFEIALEEGANMLRIGSAIFKN